MNNSYWNDILLLFPELSEQEVYDGIIASKLHIRSKVPLSGETTMKFRNGTWICDSCGTDTLGGYRTYCTGCNKKNISLG